MWKILSSVLKPPPPPSQQMRFSNSTMKVFLHVHVGYCCSNASCKKPSTFHLDYTQGDEVMHFWESAHSKNLVSVLCSQQCEKVQQWTCQGDASETFLPCVHSTSQFAARCVRTWVHTPHTCMWTNVLVFSPLYVAHMSPVLKVAGYQDIVLWPQAMFNCEYLIIYTT